MNLIIVNGERDWQHYLPEYGVYHRRLQTSQWMYQDGKVWVFEANNALRVDAVLWRLGAVKPEQTHRDVLETLRFSGVPCVNSAQTLLRGYDRISMLTELKNAGVPTVAFSLFIGETILEAATPNFPCVVKVGNYHGGWGKALVKDSQSWSDVRDLAFTSKEYVTIEPYIRYKRDIRILGIAEQFWAMHRRSESWKVNRGVADYELIQPPAQLVKFTQAAMKNLDADVLALDFLEDENGNFVALESNDIPGFSGFPEVVRHAVAQEVRKKLSF